jgi:nucleoside-diphosphate-sugar epimerase
MKCTVLGGRGFIGQHLVRYLESVGCDVWVPERDESSLLQQPLGHIFYCIGLTADFRSRPFDTVRAHVTMLSELLEHADFDSLLYLSSTRVYSRSTTTAEDNVLNVLSKDPSDLYNLSKLMGESLCLSSGQKEVRIARLSNVVGAKMGSDNLVGGLLQEAHSGLIRLKTHPDSTKDYILIDDVIRILWLIANDGHERIYNVASGIQTAHHQWLTVLHEITGCIVQTDPLAPLQSFPVIDVQRIRKEFGFKPTTIFDVFPQLVKTLGI